VEQPLSQLDFRPGPERDDVDQLRDFRDGERTGEFFRADALDKGEEEGAGGLLGEPSDPEDVGLFEEERHAFGCRRKRSAAVVKGGKVRSGRGIRVVAARGCGCVWGRCTSWSTCCS
jgi:hypothetical protein